MKAADSQMDVGHGLPSWVSRSVIGVPNVFGVYRLLKHFDKKPTAWPSRLHHPQTEVLICSSSSL